MISAPSPQPHQSNLSPSKFDLRKKSKSPETRNLFDTKTGTTNLNLNKQTMVKAIQDVVFTSGQLSEQMKIQKREVMAFIQTTKSNDHMVILLKGQSKSMLTRYGFSAMYQLKPVESASDDNENVKELVLQKVYGKTSTLSPFKLEQGMVEKYFKYSAA